MKTSQVKSMSNYYGDDELITMHLYTIHCTENPNCVFSEMKLRDVVPNSYTDVSVSDLYIPRIGMPIWLQQNRQTDPGII